MSLENLPEEVLIHIMLYLTPSERLNCAAVCRRMARVLTAPELIDGVKLDIAGFEMRRAMYVLRGTHRPYRNLRIYRAKLLSCDARFWGRIGQTLRELELFDCRWWPGTLYKILGRCPKLESLKIIGGPPTKDFELPESADPHQTRESLKSIQHIELDVDFPEELLILLLTLMSGITSVSLHAGRVSALSFLFLVLGLHQNINKVDFNNMKLSDKSFADFLGLCSGRLQELRLRCNLFSERSYRALSLFTELRHLSLRGETSGLRDSDVCRILVSNPHLKSLAIDDCSGLTTEAFSVPHALKHLELRKFCFPPAGAWRFLPDWHSNQALHTLDLKNVDVKDSDMWILACLKNLRELSLDSALSPGFLDVVVENFRGLEKLFLGPFTVVTDRDGVNLHRLTKLKKLQILESVGSTDRTVERGVGSSMMECIWISGCALTDTGLASIAAHHGRLRDVTISRCGRITLAGLIDFLQREPQLHAFTFYCNDRFGDELLRKLEDLCPRLRYLNLRRQRKTDAVRRFHKVKPYVRLTIGFNG